MEGITHILSPLSAAWCGWAMLVLFLCAILSEFFQPGVITQATSSLFARSDRTYKDAPTNIQAQTLIALFRIGTLGMALCLCFHTGDHFRFVSYLAVCGIVTGILFVKMLCNLLLDYTFMLSRRFTPAYEHYANVSTIAVCFLYPSVLIALRTANPVVGQWVFGVVTALFLLMWTYRAIRIYVNSFRSILYLILYICTLEVLPLGILTYLSMQTISVL